MGIVEGITEWLPISSTGHMILLEQIIKFNASEEFMSMFRRPPPLLPCRLLLRWEMCYTDAKTLFLLFYPQIKTAFKHPWYFC